MIHVAHGICDKSGEYSRHLATTMASYLSNTNQKVCVHIFHDNTLSDKNKKKLGQLASKCNAEVKFHMLANEWKNRVKKIANLVGNLTVGALFRLEMPEILTDIDKIIYLDLDVICNLDIKSMWDIDLASYPVAVVRDSQTYINKAKSYSFYKKTKILGDNYFNSGVLVLNLSKIREENSLLNECVEFFNRHPDAPCCDQDALNYLFQDKCYFMDSNYNMIADDVFGDIATRKMDKKDWHGKCWHFAGEEKPWFSKKYPIFELYWHYFAMTPWGDSPEKLVHWMYKIEGMPLEEAMLSYRIVSRKKFIQNFLFRLYKETRKKFLL